MVAGCLVGVERVSTTIVCCTAGPMPTARIVRAEPRQANRLSNSILVHFNDIGDTTHLLLRAQSNCRAPHGPAARFRPSGDHSDGICTEGGMSLTSHAILFCHVHQMVPTFLWQRMPFEGFSKWPYRRQRRMRHKHRLAPGRVLLNLVYIT
jgi:hypothetical protein